MIRFLFFLVGGAARSGRHRVGERRVYGARRLHPLRLDGEVGVQRDGHGAAAAHHPQGRQTDGRARRRRPRVAAAQVRLLHEGHGAHVPVPLAGTHHPVPGALIR